MGRATAVRVLVIALAGVALVSFVPTAGTATPGLVAAYGFEEGSGTTTADASGNGNTGTLVNATWTTSGKYGKALSFNGTNARVDIPDAASLHLTTGMTLEAWVNPTTVTSKWRDVIYKASDAVYLEGTSTGGTGPVAGATIGGGGTEARSPTALTAGTWAYLAETYDGTTLRLYVNGTQVASTAKTGSIASSTSPLQIGGDSLFNQFFAGSIDEVRVYNAALTAAQIQTDMTTPVVSGGGGGDTTPPSAPGTLTANAVSTSEIDLTWGAATDNVGVTGYRVERCQGAGCTSFAQIATPGGTSFNDTTLSPGTTYRYQVRAVDGAGNLGAYSNIASATTQTGTSTPSLVGAYGFEEGSGTTTVDSSGNGNTGTLVNATWSTNGKFGDALSFNGTNARVDIPDAASLHLSTGMTLEAWVDPTTVTSKWRDVIYKANDNYYLEATSTGTNVPVAGSVIGGTSTQARGTAALPASTWSYLAATYDGANLRLYVNGTLVATTPKTGPITTSTNPLQIGGDSLFSQFFSGLIDEVRVYNGALTAGQIQTDMATPVVSGGGGGGDTTPPSAPGTLTANAVAPGQINLIWGAATDNVGVTGYRIDRCQGTGCTNFSHLAQLTGTGTTYSDTTVVASTTYRYQVSAVDGAGNIGPVSNPASATTPAGTTPSLVAAYGFEEGSGTTTADASGNGNTGTLVNATWTTSGKYGKALSFNGTNARVDIPDAASLHLTTGMTLEAWVDPSAVSGAWRDVIYKANDNFYLEATSTAAGNGPVGGAIIGGTHAEGRAGSALQPGAWAYLALTYDGSNVRLYMNGALVATTPATGSITTSTNPLQIGGDTLFGQYFSGLIDEVRIYNAALSSTQVQTDMVTPIGVPSAPSNLTASAVSANEIDLAWGASTDTAGVTGYQVERCSGPGCTTFAQIATPTATTFNDTLLAANTSYSYRVRAVDAAGKLGPYSNVASGFTGLLVSPRAVPLTPGSIQQFNATVPGGGSPSVTWAVDGIPGGSATSGTITPAGIYTAPAAVGQHTVTATASGGSSGTATAYTTNYAGAFTFHYDNARSGANANEPVLNPSNVNAATFGKVFTYPLDGVAYASPLYDENVSIPGQGTHNVVYVATEHDSVYAFDADGKSSTPLWKTSFINPAAGVTTVPAGDTGECCDIAPEIGITGTPVIDPSTNTLYVVAKSKEVSGGTTTYVQRLHALDLSTGAEKFGGPVVISATVPGTGNGSTNGQLPFDPLRENQHTALTLANGNVYFGFSSHGDHQPYHGWVFAYNASNLQRTFALCLTPNQEGAGVWMSGSGFAVDSSGSIYMITGDGEFDANTGGPDYGDSYLKLSPSGTITDYFTPSSQNAINQANVDLGSGGPVLLPDQPGAHPHEMLSAGKDGSIYLVDRDNMGHYNATTNTNIQTLTNIFPNGSPEPGNFTAPVYYNGKVFFGPLTDTIQAFTLTNGLLSTSPTLRSSETYPDRGASISVSASSATANGILWAVQRNDVSPGILRAYDIGGSGGGQLAEIYNSGQAGTRDTLDVAAKFVAPVVANGRVYVGGMSQLTVYGLLP